MLWTGNQEELEHLLTHLNLMMKTIKFTMSQDSNSITFLDLEIYKGRRFAQKGILNIKPYIHGQHPDVVDRQPGRTRTPANTLEPDDEDYQIHHVSRQQFHHFLRSRDL